MPMSLMHALEILTRVHTRDDDVTGFMVVSTGGPERYFPECSQEEYVEAWRAVRAAIEKPTGRDTIVDTLRLVEQALMVDRALAQTVHFSIVETSAATALTAVREELRDRGA